MTFWQGECSLCRVGCEEWVLFLKFHTCDRRERERERERKEAGGIESSLGLSQHLCTFSSLSLLRFLTVDSDWERNLPPVVLHKNTKMYCHTPHTFFSHTQAFSRTDTFFSMFYALFSLSFSKTPFPLLFLIFTQIFTLQHTQTTVFHFCRSCKWQIDATPQHTGEVRKWPSREIQGKSDACTYKLRWYVPVTRLCPEKGIS